MPIKEAMLRLYDLLQQEPWVVGVGVGQEEQHDVIFLYVTHNAPSQVSQFSKEDWLGFPVVVRRSGGITPAVP